MKTHTRLLPFFLVAALWAGRVQAQVQPFNYWVPPSNCVSSVSGNSTGTNGQTTAGSSGTPVVQAQTTSAGSNTHTYICNISPPVSLVNTAGNRIRILDAVFVYGESSSALATPQAAVLASGTFNGSTVFSYIAYPTPGANETASAVAPVRADTGTLVMTPTLLLFNTDTLTAGRFFTVMFTPSTPILWNTDGRQLLMTVTLKNAPGFATVTNSPGVLVHIRSN